uniref:Uncharacterized protein n=1 Tax=virus sp. ctML55 TaxID=2827627 RepID=A0A8S5RHV2_9VIRU|nr:MAG TPA: hypothetical protein [virus sp. ctML55]DAJ95575.1 MAG TPA: hypothetical protein [Caudoviricetes sp.]DAV60053.1 MAG TPA: hypothetical protein [Caudoviricetes sp.]DAX00417.1 MAG TPA: hypothetical protein [Bacteriophage sp.]
MLAADELIEVVILFTPALSPEPTILDHTDGN